MTDIDFTEGKATTKGFRLRWGRNRMMLLVAIQERHVATTPDGTLQFSWFFHCQLSIWLGTSRHEVDRLLTHFVQYFDPDLSKGLPEVTGWIDELSEYVPPQPESVEGAHGDGRGSLN